MASVSIAEAEGSLGELIAKARSGEDVTITADGKAVARLVAEVEPTAAFDPDEIDRIRALSRPWDGQGSFVVWAKERNLL
jgi:prevent-host-death family protein